MKILLELSCAFRPSNLTGNGTPRILGEKRTQQYIDGFDSFFKNFSYLNSVDIVLTDNTVDCLDQIDKRIVSYFPEKLILKIKNDNNIAEKNNGAGCIVSWLRAKETIANYDWIIHHEPRLTMRHMQFVNSAIENPRNLFTLNKNPNAPKHFNTGLFCIDSKLLLNYCETANIESMCSSNISVEYEIFNFINNSKVSYDTFSEMGVIWHSYENKQISM